MMRYIGWTAAIVTTFLLVSGSASAVTFADWWTMAETKIALLADPAVAGMNVDAIEVDARDGVVTLRGQVATDEALQAAATAAGRIAGVKTVVNELRVDGDDLVSTVGPDDRTIRRSVIRTLRREPRLARTQIQVGVLGGVVRLTGAVPATWDRVRASEVARGVIGVVAVENDTVPTRVALEAGRR